jgi:hypothetical protein
LKVCFELKPTLHVLKPVDLQQNVRTRLIGKPVKQNGYMKKLSLGQKGHSAIATKLEK